MKINKSRVTGFLQLFSVQSAKIDTGVNTMDKALPLIAQLEWTHVWLAAITALWGGAVSYFRRVQAGLKHSWISAFMHMSMSGFAGLLCWLGCLQFDVPAPLTAICTGLAGHMGAEFIKIIETRFESKLAEGMCVPPLDKNS